MDPAILHAALPAASIIDSIVNVATDFIDSVGVWGVFILMTLESACIPLPSEATMRCAGCNVSTGDMSLFGAVFAGVAGNLVGSWIAYAVGYYGRLELVDRHHWLNRKRVEWADNWFQRHGDITVLVTRMLPIIRTFISLPRS